MPVNTNRNNFSDSLLFIYVQFNNDKVFVLNSTKISIFTIINAKV